MDPVTVRVWHSPFSGLSRAKCLRFIGQGVAMEGELQELRDLVAQLKVDNEKLR